MACRLTIAALALLVFGNVILESQAQRACKGTELLGKPGKRKSTCRYQQLVELIDDVAEPMVEAATNSRPTLVASAEAAMRNLFEAAKQRVEQDFSDFQNLAAEADHDIEAFAATANSGEESIEASLVANDAFVQNKESTLNAALNNETAVRQAGDERVADSNTAKVAARQSADAELYNAQDSIDTQLSYLTDAMGDDQTGAAAALDAVMSNAQATFEGAIEANISEANARLEGLELGIATGTAAVVVEQNAHDSTAIEALGSVRGGNMQLYEDYQFTIQNAASDANLNSYVARDLVEKQNDVIGFGHTKVAFYCEFSGDEDFLLTLFDGHTWTNINTSGTDAGDMGYVRGATPVVYDDTTVHLVGGLVYVDNPETFMEVTDRVVAIDLSSNTVLANSSYTLPQGRAYGQAAWINGSLVYVGGLEYFEKPGRDEYPKYVESDSTVVLHRSLDEYKTRPGLDTSLAGKPFIVYNDAMYIASDGKIFVVNETGDVVWDVAVLGGVEPSANNFSTGSIAPFFATSDKLFIVDNNSPDNSTTSIWAYNFDTDSSGNTLISVRQHFFAEAERPADGKYNIFYHHQCLFWVTNNEMYQACDTFGPAPLGPLHWKPVVMPDMPRFKRGCSAFEVRSVARVDAVSTASTTTESGCLTNDTSPATALPLEDLNSLDNNPDGLNGTLCLYHDDWLDVSFNNHCPDGQVAKFSVFLSDTSDDNVVISAVVVNSTAPVSYAETQIRSPSSTVSDLWAGCNADHEVFLKVRATNPTLRSFYNLRFSQTASCAPEPSCVV